LVRSLLKEADEDVDMEVDAASHEGPNQKDMWMDPSVAIEILEGTSEKYESLTTLFNKVEWS
jgi:hypothetical protein